MCLRSFFKSWLFLFSVLVSVLLFSLQVNASSLVWNVTIDNQTDMDVNVSYVGMAYWTVGPLIVVPAHSKGMYLSTANTSSSGQSRHLNARVTKTDGTPPSGGDPTAYDFHLIANNPPGEFQDRVFYPGTLTLGVDVNHGSPSNPQIMVIGRNNLTQGSTYDYGNDGGAIGTVSATIIVDGSGTTTVGPPSYSRGQ